jgi:YbgC/YbaW family acyl-CoA thioester hydrolase
MSGRTWRERIRVRFNETDAAGIVFFANYFVWADVATESLLRMDAVSGAAPDGAPRFPLPIVECGATFLAPTRFDDELDIETRIESIGTSSVRFAHTITRTSGEVVARLFVQRVLVGFVDGTLVKQPLPDELRAYLTREA